MKKLMLMTCSIAFLALAACGGDTQEDKEKAKQDSINSEMSFDSLMMKANQAAEDTTQSDSVK